MRIRYYTIHEVSRVEPLRGMAVVWISPFKSNSKGPKGD